MSYIHGYSDYGDLFDNVKWDFDVSSLVHVVYKNKIYKINKRRTSEEDIATAKFYHNLREIVDDIHDKLKKLKKTDKYHKLDKEFKNGIEIFLELHDPNNNRYFISEIPINTKNIKKFEAINIPRNRHYINGPSVGPDETLRAEYRDIFFNPFIESDIVDTLLHELNHTICNHLRYRDAGNHKADFKRAESLIRQLYYTKNN